MYEEQGQYAPYDPDAQPSMYDASHGNRKHPPPERERSPQRARKPARASTTHPNQSSSSSSSRRPPPYHPYAR
jgi:BRCT domain type II-containing protein